MPRSWARVDPATAHPWPSVPTRCSAGTKTSERKTSLNSVSPVICTRGRTSMPAPMSTMSAVMPRCAAARRLGAGQAEPPGRELGVGGPHLAPGHQVAPLDRDGRGRERGQVAARLGLAEELAPELLGREDGRQVAQALVLGAVGQQGRAHQVDAHPVDRLGRLGAGVLALVERHLDRRGAPAPVGRGPVHADPALGRQRGLPLASPGHLVGQVDEGGWAARGGATGATMRRTPRPRASARGPRRPATS